MISSITKRQGRLFWVALILLISCSSRKDGNKTPSDRELDQALDSIQKPAQEAPTHGPTMMDGTSRFIDKTSTYGLDGIEGVAFYAIDLNRDTYPDLVVLPGYYNQPRFFLFDPAANRYRESSNNPFSEGVSAGLMTFADFNRDGVMDVVVGVLNQRGEFSKVPITLWYGRWLEGGLLRFEPAHNFVKLPAEPTSAFTVLDVDLDGRLDLFVGNWYGDRKGSPIPTADRLLLNKVDGWQDRSDWLRGERDQRPSDIYPPLAKPTYGASSCDLDQNGFPEVLTATSGGHHNKLWLNTAPPSGPNSEGRRFEDVGRTSNYAADPNGFLVPTGGGRTFTAVCADYNDDGIMDIFLGELTHSWDPIAVDRSSVLTGARNILPLSFLRTEYMSDNVSDNWNQGDKRALWADLNLDGLVDLIVENTGFPPHSRLVAFRQDETRAFLNVARQWGMDIVNPVGTILLDINRDGKLDLISGQSNIRQANIKNRLYVFENNLSVDGGRAHIFHLQGRDANDAGIGAMVMLYTLKNGQQVIQRRWNEFVQGGLSSQMPEGVHFGVEQSAKVVGVKVRWPIVRGGRRAGRALERLYKIEEKKSAVQVWTVCEDGRLLEGRLKCTTL